MGSRFEQYVLNCFVTACSRSVVLPRWRGSPRMPSARMQRALLYAESPCEVIWKYSVSVS